MLAFDHTGQNQPKIIITLKVILHTIDIFLDQKLLGLIFKFHLVFEGKNSLVLPGPGVPFVACALIVSQ